MLFQELAVLQIKAGRGAMVPAGSDAVVAVQRLISNLKVNARLQETQKHDVLLFRAAIPAYAACLGFTAGENA